MQGDHISNDLKKKPGKFKQLKMMANHAIEEGTKTLLRSMHVRQHSLISSEMADYSNWSTRTNTPTNEVIPGISQYINILWLA